MSLPRQFIVYLYFPTSTIVWLFNLKLEKVAINDVLTLKAARRDSIAELKSFWGFESELQTNPMPFHLDSLWAPR